MTLRHRVLMIAVLAVVATFTPSAAEARDQVPATFSGPGGRGQS